VAEQEREQLIRRILVALYASAHSLAALETAVRLAANLRAELTGLFVEDVNLLRLADLPFAREVRTLSATTHQLNSQRVAADMRTQAARAQRALLRAAEESQLPTSFRIVRGHVPSELLAAAGEADLLLLGRTSRPVTQRSRLGSTARIVVTRAPRSVLLTQRGGLTGNQPIMVTYDGSELGRRALQTAVSLARPDRELVVLLLADTRERAQELQAEVNGWLKEKEISMSYRWQSRTDAAGLAWTAQAMPCSLLVVGSERVQLPEEQLYWLLDTVNCALMVVR
jgi:nucleotide-binding universal stress UspA family protein